MADVREQLISSYIDLNIFNTLLTFNYFPVEAIFFIAFKENKLTTQQLSSSALLATYSNASKQVPYHLLNNEYQQNKLYFSLDNDKSITSANRDVTLIDRSTILSAEWRFIQVI